MADYPKTDMGNSRIFASLYGEKVKYDKTSGKWLAWDGKRWDRVGGEMQAQLYCRGIALYWYQQLGNCVDKEERAKVFKHWQYTSSATGVRNTLFLAKSEPGIAVSVNDIDKHPFMLNVLDGTIDLKKGVIKPHDPKDLITQLAPVNFCVDLEHPSTEKWDNCMRKWHPDGEIDGMWDYLQQLMGYCLTGDTSSRCFPIFWGTGKNGKNVFLDTFLLMMGDYATIAPRTLIEAAVNREEHPAEIADMWGKRLVLASEPKKGTKLKTSLVKAMTGDKMMKARFMRQDFFEFTPTHKVIMMTQNLPVIDETADAIWDRIHKLRWGVRIEKEEQDPKLTDKLKEEWTGILRWALDGCLKWQEKGILFPTKKIEHETEEYREGQNPAKKFVETHFVIGSGMFVPSSSIRGTLDVWNKFSDGMILAVDDLYAYLKERGCISGVKKSHGEVTRGWHGLGVRNEW